MGGGGGAWEDASGLGMVAVSWTCFFADGVATLGRTAAVVRRRWIDCWRGRCFHAIGTGGLLHDFAAIVDEREAKVNR